MIEYTIDDAIAKCKDRANISALHHMMRTSQEWELTAVWLQGRAAGEADQACGPEL